MNNSLLNRRQLAERWNCSERKIDRLRNNGFLPWIDLTAGHGKKPIVRLRIEDILQFEIDNLMDIRATGEGER